MPEYIDEKHIFVKTNYFINMNTGVYYAAGVACKSYVFQMYCSGFLVFDRVCLVTASLRMRMNKKRMQMISAKEK